MATRNLQHNPHGSHYISTQQDFGETVVSEDLLVVPSADSVSAFLLFLSNVLDPQAPSELLAPCVSPRLSRGTPLLPDL